MKQHVIPIISFNLILLQIDVWHVILRAILAPPAAVLIVSHAREVIIFCLGDVLLLVLSHFLRMLQTTSAMLAIPTVKPVQLQVLIAQCVLLQNF